MTIRGLIVPDYGGQRRSDSGTVVRIFVAVLAIVALCWIVRLAWPRAVLQWTLRQAKIWEAPSGGVVFDESAGSAALLTKNDYICVATGPGGTRVAAYRPPFWPRLIRAAGMYDDHSFAIIAASVRRAGGNDRLVCILFKVASQGGFLNSVELTPVVFPASVSIADTHIARHPDSTSGVGSSLFHGAVPRNLRVFAGHPDAKNSSRIIIEYETFGVHRTVYADLLNDDSVRFDWAVGFPVF